DDDEGVVIGDAVLDLALEVAARDEDGAGDHALFELVELAHVEERGGADLCLGLGRLNLSDLRFRLLQQVAIARHHHSTSIAGMSLRGCPAQPLGRASRHKSYRDGRIFPTAATRSTSAGRTVPSGSRTTACATGSYGVSSAFITTS